MLPVGGGGLLAGVGVAVKTRRPDVLVIGVEPAGAAKFTAACAEGHPVTIQCSPTLADGLAVPDIGANALPIARAHLDKLVTVHEDEIALAILRSGVSRVHVLSCEDSGDRPAVVRLARRLAALDVSTVLVDLSEDGAPASLAGLAPFAPGVGEVCEGRATVASIIHRDGGSACHVIAAGTVPWDAAVEDVRDLLAVLEKAYDVVVVDCGRAVLTRLSDAETALVLSTSPTSEDDAAAALSILAGSGFEDVVLLDAQGAGAASSR